MKYFLNSGEKNFQSLSCLKNQILPILHRKNSLLLFRHLLHFQLPSLHSYQCYYLPCNHLGRDRIQHFFPLVLHTSFHARYNFHLAPELRHRLSFRYCQNLYLSVHTRYLTSRSHRHSVPENHVHWYNPSDSDGLSDNNFHHLPPLKYQSDTRILLPFPVLWRKSLPRRNLPLLQLPDVHSTG